jgi:hypothetical protein
VEPDLGGDAGVPGLFGNVPAAAGEPAVWSLQHPVAYTLIWTVLIIAPLRARPSAHIERVGSPSMS